VYYKVIVTIFCVICAVFVSLSIISCILSGNVPGAFAQLDYSNDKHVTTTSEHDITTTTEVAESTLVHTTTTTVTATTKPVLDVGQELYTSGNVDKNLSDELAFVLNDYGKNISIVCWSVDGSKVLEYNTKQSYFSACTVKMPVMYSYCKLADQGLLDINKELTYTAEHFYKGSGDIRYQPYGSKYTTAQLITKSLSISDNVAYVMLLDEYDKAPVNTLMNELGCNSIMLSSSSKWAKNIKAKDLAVVWSEIYNYFCSNSPNAKILKNACTNTPYNYGTKVITEYEYSHKSGNNYGEFCAYNDAGIVWSEVPYVYVVLTDSEGTQYDINTINSVMKIVNKIMTEC
jgi:beta-lactamase class A